MPGEGRFCIVCAESILTGTEVLAEPGKTASVAFLFWE
jgi:hypothetical protein